MLVSPQGCTSGRRCSSCWDTSPKPENGTQTGFRKKVGWSPKSVGFLLWGTWMSVEKFMAIPPTVLMYKIFLSVVKLMDWRTNRLTLPSLEQYLLQSQIKVNRLPCTHVSVSLYPSSRCGFSTGTLLDFCLPASKSIHPVKAWAMFQWQENWFRNRGGIICMTEGADAVIKSAPQSNLDM